VLPDEDDGGLRGVPASCKRFSSWLSSLVALANSASTPSRASDLAFSEALLCAALGELNMVKALLFCLLER